MNEIPKIPKLGIKDARVKAIEKRIEEWRSFFRQQAQKSAFFKFFDRKENIEDVIHEKFGIRPKDFPTEEILWGVTFPKHSIDLSAYEHNEPEVCSIIIFLRDGTAQYRLEEGAELRELDSFTTAWAMIDMVAERNGRELEILMTPLPTQALSVVDFKKTKQVLEDRKSDFEKHPIAVNGHVEMFPYEHSGCFYRLRIPATREAFLNVQQGRNTSDCAIVEFYWYSVEVEYSKDVYNDRDVDPVFATWFIEVYLNVSTWKTWKMAYDALTDLHNRYTEAILRMASPIV